MIRKIREKVLWALQDESNVNYLNSIFSRFSSENRIEFLYFFDQRYIKKEKLTSKKEKRVITRHFNLGIPKYARKNNCISFETFLLFSFPFYEHHLLSFSHDFLILLLFLLSLPRFLSFSFIKKVPAMCEKNLLLYFCMMKNWKVRRNSFPLRSIL